MHDELRLVPAIHAHRVPQVQRRVLEHVREVGERVRALGDEHEHPPAMVLAHDRPVRDPLRALDAQRAGGVEEHERLRHLVPSQGVGWLGVHREVEDPRPTALPAAVRDERRLVAGVRALREPAPAAREEPHVAVVGIELPGVEDRGRVRPLLPLDDVERPPAAGLRVVVNVQLHLLGVDPQHGDRRRATPAVRLAAPRRELQPRRQLVPVQAAGAPPQHEAADEGDDRQDPARVQPRRRERVPQATPA